MTPGPFRFGWVSHASSAERLIGVYLLDCAAEFLETQIDHRLTGGAKAWAGSQLAQVCLFDRQPDKVLQALDSGYLLGLAVDLTGEHHRVRAQALQTADRRGRRWQLSVATRARRHCAYVPRFSGTVTMGRRQSRRSNGWLRIRCRRAC